MKSPIGKSMVLLKPFQWSLSTIDVQILYYICWYFTERYSPEEVDAIRIEIFTVWRMNRGSRCHSFQLLWFPEFIYISLSYWEVPLHYKHWSTTKNKSPLPPIYLVLHLIWSPTFLDQPTRKNEKKTQEHLWRCRISFRVGKYCCMTRELPLR